MLEPLKKQLRKLDKTREQWEETRTYIQVHGWQPCQRVSQGFTSDRESHFVSGSKFLLRLKPLKMRKRSGRNSTSCTVFWWKKREIG